MLLLFLPVDESLNAACSSRVVRGYGLQKQTRPAAHRF